MQMFSAVPFKVTASSLLAVSLLLNLSGLLGCETTVGVGVISVMSFFV